MSKTNRSAAKSYNHATKTGLFQKTEPLIKESVDILKLKTIVQARSNNQKGVLKTIRDNDITFVVGPPGSGKSHLAVGMAAYYLSKKMVEKIIVTRPTVEGEDEEKHGFLPGTLDDKICPYLRPIFDELSYFFTNEQMKLLRSGDMPILEIAPLSVIVKGRTFKNAFVIMDEAQDATYKQLKRFITRLGEGSTMVFTGDTSQSDLRGYFNRRTELEDFMEKLYDIEGIGFSKLDPSDIVRHPLLALIIERV